MATTRTPTSVRPDLGVELPSLKPLALLPAAAIFLALGLLFRVFVYGGIPFLEDLGMHQVDAFLISFTLPSLFLFVLAFILVKREGNPMTRASLSERFQLHRFGWRHLLLVIGAAISAVVVTLLLSPTTTWIAELSSWLGPGDTLPPPIDPTNSAESFTDSAVSWMGADAAGHWRWAVMILVLYFFNIVGEELMWRGVLWPRQELVHGKRTWLVHGLMWNLFHLPFYPWYLISGLPQTLLLSYVHQKTKNTSVQIALHAIFNALFYVTIFMITMGFID